jgi:hypothetical protein
MTFITGPSIKELASELLEKLGWRYLYVPGKGDRIAGGI